MGRGLTLAVVVVVVGRAAVVGGLVGAVKSVDDELLVVDPGSLVVVDGRTTIPVVDGDSLARDVVG